LEGHSKRTEVIDVAADISVDVEFGHGSLRAVVA
jgi:hypothetical protein